MRVLVAMSGGVDSTVAAKILMEEGWEVGGAYMLETAAMRSGLQSAWEFLSIYLIWFPTFGKMYWIIFAMHI